MSGSPDASTGRVELTVRGTVQGVGFRWFAQREATRLGLDGWVANQADGSVVAIAEGPAAAIDALVLAFHDGPPGAWVREVRVHREPVRGEPAGFRIRSGAHGGD
jgi:acylphosphatase